MLHIIALGQVLLANGYVFHNSAATKRMEWDGQHLGGVGVHPGHEQEADKNNQTAANLLYPAPNEQQ